MTNEPTMWTSEELTTAIRNGSESLDSLEADATTESERMRAITLHACFKMLADELKAVYPQLRE